MMRSWHGYNRVWTGPRCRLQIVAPVVACALVLSACAETARDRTSDLPEIELVALPPIDGQAIPGMAGFGKIADLEIGEDGSVFVLDEMNRMVHVFDHQGTLLRTFGRRGRGPGELEQPGALTWGPDGHLWIVDSGNARYTVFDRNGSLVATYRGADPYVFHPLAVGFSATGLLYTVTVALEFGSLERPNTVLIESEVRNGQVSELRRIDLSFVEQPPTFRHQGSGMVLMLRIPFSSETIFRLDPDGQLWYAETGEPWVHRWSPASGVEQTVGREFDPRSVTQAELQEVLEDERVEELRQAAGPEVFAEFTSLIPDTKPYLQGFFLDDEENVWIIRSGPNTAGDDTLAMDVYDPSGRLVGFARAALAPEPRPRARDGLMAAVRRDELGTESIALYRIRR